MTGPFVVNVADAPAVYHERGGWSTAFEGPERRFEQLGVNIRVLAPGQPNGLYHSETVPEAFLVLGGECLLIIDGEERALKQWDFVHCPAGTGHIFVGAGDGPCTILMAGVRGADGNGLHYPVNELAAAYGASVAEETSEPRQAYADWGSDFRPGPLPWPPA
ncbi:MAG TPA: cupin domain-containing protein [Solirubrobacteraceae bacterium]|jgi:uncharacterized cupin superfamily protein|nr:cupin domain-containing protein [Solirubrobacteraceae bacterium]